MLIGSCGYKGKPDEKGVVEIGYEVAPSYRNRGFATEMAQALIDHAFRNENVKLVRAHTLAEENPSVKVLKKSGFHFIGETMDPEDGRIWISEIAGNNVSPTLKDFNFRQASLGDIPKMHAVRMAVKENMLQTPSLVNESDYVNFLTVNGKGWLCETDNRIVGLAIIDTHGNNIWGLFVHPDYEKRGIGKKLQGLMLDWFFSNNRNTLWLGTAPGTRAETFYQMSGWKKVGIRNNGEIKFEMTYEDWKNSRAKYADTVLDPDQTSF